MQLKSLLSFLHRNLSVKPTVRKYLRTTRHHQEEREGSLAAGALTYSVLPVTREDASGPITTHDLRGRQLPLCPWEPVRLTPGQAESPNGTREFYPAWCWPHAQSYSTPLSRPPGNGHQAPHFHVKGAPVRALPRRVVKPRLSSLANTGGRSSSFGEVLPQ